MESSFESSVQNQLLDLIIPAALQQVRKHFEQVVQYSVIDKQLQVELEGCTTPFSCDINHLHHQLMDKIEIHQKANALADQLIIHFIHCFKKDDQSIDELMSKIFPSC